jgi:hypothetical protein
MPASTSIETRRLFADPESAIRMISRSSALVTRRPAENRASTPWSR